jgi:signal transduction histidine kinase/CheY-like chemotaxis protein
MKSSRISSIGVSMFRTVMTVYMVVAMLATLLLIYEEYKSSREGVLRELKMFEDVFDSLLAPNFWTHDLEKLESDADGMLTFPIISGVMLSDHKDRILISKFIDEKNRSLSESQRHGSKARTRLKNLRHRFPVFLSDTNFYNNNLRKDELIGYVTVFAIENVEFIRIRSRVFFIILTAIVKISALWIIFLWVSQRMLTNPLVRLNSSLTNLDIDNPATVKLDLQVTGDNELTLLESTFNRVGKRLYETYKEKERAMKLEKAKERADAANKAKSIFLANMSHELRTPLTAILGFARVMTRSATLPKEHLENAGIITRSGEHLLTLINDVLDMSKIEAGRTTLNENSFDLHRMLNDLEEMFQIRAEEKHLQLLFEVDDEVPQYIRTDEIKLRQVLINLLNNALKFTKEGGVSVRIGSEVGGRRSEVAGPRAKSEGIENRKLISDAVRSAEDQQPATSNQQPATSNQQPATSNIQHPILFEVEDTGPGIAPDELDSLFEAFVQTETGRQSQEGTGLGLPISRKFVQMMGGDIIVSSQVGCGTVFRFEIRAYPADSSDIREFRTDRHVIAIEPGQTRFRILIVDDKADNRHLLVKLLNPLGFELREAENGQQAVEIWEEWEPHLIWMDMRMPVMNGYEAAGKIKETAKGQATAVIALTASAFEEERSLVLSAGCDDFLRKPFRESDIYDMMTKHIGIRFVYETSENKTARDKKEPEPASPMPDTLAVLPPEILTELEQASIDGNSEKVYRVISDIRLCNEEAADALTLMADEFEFDRILELIQKSAAGV